VRRTSSIALVALVALVALWAEPVRADAPHGGVTGDMDCNACHTADSWKLSAGAGKAGFDHDRTHFSLRGAHNRTACTQCHTGNGTPSASCDGCHRDPHAGRMDGQCYECHTAVAWSDVKQLEQHRRTRMPLTGYHAIVDCVACHKRQGERTYSDLPVDCYACHRSEFHAASTHPNHDGTDPSGNQMPFSRECQLCHTTMAWSPAVANPASVMPRIQQQREHDGVFALSTGSHRAVDCNGCHVDVRRPRAVRCDGCHLASELRSQHGKPVAPTAATCMRCHPAGMRR
jgi:hypothetical protein